MTAKNDKSVTRIAMSEDQYQGYVQRMRDMFARVTKEEDMTDQDRLDVYTAVHGYNKDAGGDSNDRTLLHLAALVALKATWPVISKDAYKFLNNLTEIDEYKHAYYIYITETIAAYNPDYPLKNYYASRIANVMSQTYNKSRGNSISGYYNSIKASIIKAIDDLAKIGNTDPSDADIRDYMLLYYDKDISVKTIGQCRAMHQTRVDLTDALSSSLKSDDLSPEDLYIRTEASAELYAAIDDLSPQYRDNVLAQLEYEALYGQIPNDQQLAQYLRAIDGKTHKAYVVNNTTKKAYQALRRKLTRKNTARSAHTPVNRYITPAEDEDMMQEQEDILNALDAEFGLDAQDNADNKDADKDDEKNTPNT